MEGPTPDWANVDDYATLEEVFGSPDFGHPLPAAAATAGLAAALASTPGTHLLRNRAIALTSVLAATLSVVLGLLFTGPASTPVVTAQHAPLARTGHGAGPVPTTAPTPPAGRAGATTAPTAPPSPSSLGGSQLASSSSSPGRGQDATLGTGTSGAAPATQPPAATLTVLTNNPPATTTTTAPTRSTATTTTTTTAPPRSTTTPTTSPPRWPTTTTTTTAPPKISSGGASGGGGPGSGNSGGRSGCDCNCNGYGSSDGGGKRDGTATSTTAAPERVAPARVSERGRAGTW